VGVRAASADRGAGLAAGEVLAIKASERVSDSASEQERDRHLSHPGERDELGRDDMTATSTSLRPRAAESTGTGVVLALAATHAAVDIPIGAFGALLPTLKSRFGLSQGELAGMVAVFAAASLLTQPFAGRFADRVGTRTVAAVGAATAAALLSALSVMNSVAVVYVLLVLGGLASAAFHPAGAAIASNAKLRSRGLGVSAFAAGGTIGLAIGPLAVVLLTANGGLGAAPWLMVPGLALAIAVWRVVPATARSPRVDPASRAPMLRGPVAMLAAVATLASLASVTFISAMPLWLTQHHGLGDQSALIGWTLAAFSLACAGGGLVGSWLAGRVDVRVLVPTAFLLSAVPLCFALLAQPGRVAYFALVIAGGTLLNAPMPVLVVAAQKAAPNATAAASGMVMGFATGTAGVLYLAVGVLADATTLSFGFIVGLLGVVPASAVALWVICPTSAALNKRLAFGVPATCGCAATPASDVPSQLLRDVALPARASNRPPTPQLSLPVLSAASYTKETS